MKTETENSAGRRQKRRLPDRLGVELALMVTVAFHAAIFFGFRPASVPERPAGADMGPDCVALPPLDQSVHWEEDLYTWAVLGDPVILTLPDETLGFSRVRRIDRVLPLTTVPRHACVVQPAVEQPLAALVLTPPPPSLAATLSARWRAPPVPLPAAPPVARMPAGIVWHSPDGMVFDDVPQMSIESVIAAIESGPPLVGVTRIEIARVGPMPRVVVRDSCGNQALDKLVVRTIRQAVLTLTLREELVGDATTVGWLPARGASAMIEVEFRLLPGAPLGKG